MAVDLAARSGRIATQIAPAQKALEDLFTAAATPMTYILDGRQYIVVAAGGHGDGSVPLGDQLIAFAVN